MNIIVLGASGMLGKQVIEECKKRNHDVFSSSFRFGDNPLAFLVSQGDIVINCAGKIPQKSPTPEEMITVNSLGPWQLARATEGWGGRLIHMSTDCVFSGKQQGPLRSTSIPDPTDLYGKSKLAGEPQGKNVLVVRGSFIGFDHGFLRWLLEAKGTIEAWVRATWNGGSASVLAKALVDLAEGDTSGIVHVGAEESVTKAWMVEYLASELDLRFGTIRVTSVPVIMRALEPDVILPSVKKSLDGLIKELNGDPKE